jgi:transmembrane sensor
LNKEKIALSLLMVPDQTYLLEDLLCDESFLRYYFQQSEDDVLDWEDWIGDDPSRQRLAEQAFRLLHVLSLQYPDAYLAEQRHLLMQRIATVSEPLLEPTFITKHRPIWWRAAAAILILFLAAWWWLPGTETGSPTAIVHTTPAAISVCKLPDGTIVRLKTGSSLRLADDFGQTARQVTLIGEGYFEVAKDPQRPFSVNAGDVKTTALGTVFNVRAYPDEAEIKVVLVEGKVKIERQKAPAAKTTKSVELQPGQQLRISNSDFSPVEQANTASIERWKSGYVLTFRATPFPEVVSVLNAHYKTYITGFEGNTLSDAKITGEFDRGMSLKEIMESLAFINGFNYQIKGDTTYISTK